VLVEYRRAWRFADDELMIALGAEALQFPAIGSQYGFAGTGFDSADSNREDTPWTAIDRTPRPNARWY
jgi:hypothetical protein